MSATIPTRLASGERAVTTEALTKAFGTQRALREVALEVPSGAVYLLVGPNGAGKSTTVKVLLDLMRADSGTATVLGLDSRRDAPSIRANIGYVPEQTSWGYDWMRVDELLAHHAAYFPSWDADYAQHLARFFSLAMDRKVGKLSKGQARRVHLTMALAHRPALLLLDEPTDGLDPLMRDETLGILVEHLAETPTTLLMSTHHVEEVERLADHVGVMLDGTLRAQLPVEELRAGLRRYRADVPDGWTGVPTLNGAVVKRTSSAREVQWVVWGAEHDIRAQMQQAGATVRESTPLTLAEATVVLLSLKE